MGRTNRASGNDRIAVQAGQIHGRDTNPPTDTATGDDTTGRTQNAVSGNAKVGIQADTVTGSIRIRM